MAEPKRTLAETPHYARSVPYAQWKAWELNSLFEERGLLKLPGNFWPDTITHGEQVRQTVPNGHKMEGHAGQGN